ncbi:MAG TPA: chemotaxis protein CheB [Steroidobacteraceae bacterium]|nr:chemotaxis protein CheB [Steroidobacteraceae bacterium]
MRPGHTRAPAPAPRAQEFPASVRQAAAQLPAGAVAAGPRAAESPAPLPPPAKDVFPIVGIGASAGGLEALEEFLRNVPLRCGMAFVIVQHLDPTHKGAVVQLLQRTTAMRVVEVTDGQKVEPDHVYVIPPNKDMSILHRVLYLLPPASPRGLNLPIDFFLRSLAADQQERSIGVVLSGMGSDGTLGVRAIKEKAGTAFVQSLESAKFDAMPRSVIDAGLADVVAAAAELPARILAYHERAAYLSKPDPELDDTPHSTLDKVFILLRSHTGNDFSFYKKSTILRRIERRMTLHQMDKMADYVRYLRENPREIELLFKELLIGVTNFFRDPGVWEHLKRDVLPELVRSRAQTRVLRAWVPGCSTGEEAYSLAIVLFEALNELKPLASVSVQIFASDVDRDAIELARQAAYPANIAADVSPERLNRFFHQEEHGYRVRKEIRDMVVFAPQNIIMDPPFTKLDILSCRNLLIYLSQEMQRKLIPLFHYALNRGGVLLLGNAETVGTFTSLFSPIDGKGRTYLRVNAPAEAPMVEFPPALARVRHLADGEPAAEAAQAGAIPAPNLPLLVDRLILQTLAPPAVLTNEKGDILYVSGRTGNYLEPAVGKANLNVLAMAREGLRYELSSAFSSALRGKEPVTVKGLKVRSNGNSQTINLTVQPVAEPKALRGTLMVVFSEVTMPPAPPPTGAARTRVSARISELERELQDAREEVQTTREEMQTSQEELKSTNEELQSTNEELQSTNEELTTSKEEMQSMNEELQTVNHELQSKMDEVSRSNNDMTNLLNSTDIATLFLDGELRVRRFTIPTTRLFNLIPTDTGRPITNITTELEYPQLPADAQEVLRTLVFKEKQIAARDGRWFSVRVLPYRTLENVIDGVVLTFTDTTAATLLKMTLRDQAIEARQMADSLPALTLGCSADGSCNYASRTWTEYTGTPEQQHFDFRWLELVHPEERERVRAEWSAALRSGAPLATEFRLLAHAIRGDSYRWFKARATPILDEQGKVMKWYLTAIDVEDSRRAAAAQREASERLATVLEEVDDAYMALDNAFTITHFNGAAERMFARARSQVVGQRFVEVFAQAGGPRLAAKLAEAVKRQRALTFQTELGDADRRQSYAIRLHPFATGVSVFCRRADGSQRASRAGDLAEQ